MAEISKIAWTKSTWNPWIGCTKISVTHGELQGGCDNCYAERQDARKVFGGATHFGTGVPRMRTSIQNWNQVRRWNKAAPNTEFAGRKGFWPVFCASLADIFDNEVPDEWRRDFWALVKECSNLTFIIVTKRVGNVEKMLPPDWGGGYPNVWLMITVVNQVEANRDISKLLKVPAVMRGLSVEPMLGPVDLRLWLGIDHRSPASRWERGGVNQGLHWVVSGGESGNNARPMHADWARTLRGQCAAAGVPYLFKQWGEWVPMMGHAQGVPVREEKHTHQDGTIMGWAGKEAAGRRLDGVLHDEFPSLTGA